MKTSIGTNLGCKINQATFLSKKSNLVSSDQHILELQDIFLEPGLHYLHVSSFQEGRTIISDYLQALRCFNEPACISLSAGDLGIPNIADDITPGQIESFFTLDFDADFLWVEYDELMKNHYPELLPTLHRVCKVPIIILTLDS